MLAALIGVAASTSPIVAVAVGAGAIFMIVAFRDLATGVALFAFTTFFELETSFATGGLTIVRLAGVGLAAAWLLRLVRDRGAMPLLIRDHPVVGFAALAFLAFALASTLWASDVSAARTSGIRLAQGILLVFIVFSALRDEQGLRRVVYAFIAGAFFTTLVALAEAGPQLQQGGRLSGETVGDPNEVASMLVPALGFSLFLLAGGRGAIARLLLVLGIAGMALALFFTQSRGGIVALGVTLVAALLLAGRLRSRVLVVTAAFIAFAFSYYKYIAPPEYLERLANFTSDRGSGRLDLWAVAVDVFRDNPVLGVGAGNFPVVKGPYAPETPGIFAGAIVDPGLVVHNTYLDVLTELGAVGFLVFALVALSVFVVAGRAAGGLAGSRSSYALGRGFLVGALGMLTAFAFVSAQYQKHLWLLLGMALALGTVRATQARGQPAFSPASMGSLGRNTQPGEGNGRGVVPSVSGPVEHPARAVHSRAVR